MDEQKQTSLAQPLVAPEARPDDASFMVFSGDGAALHSAPEDNIRWMQGSALVAVVLSLSHSHGLVATKPSKPPQPGLGASLRL